MIHHFFVFKDTFINLGSYLGLSLIIFIIAVLAFITLITHMAMPGVRCPTCFERGIEQWVLPGKHCPRCATACRNYHNFTFNNFFNYVLLMINLYGIYAIVPIILVLSAYYL